MSEEYLKNKEYEFLVFQKWSPVDDTIEQPKQEKKGYDDDDDEFTIPDVALTEYKIIQENLKKFAEDNNFWDIHTLFPLHIMFLQKVAASPGVEIVAIPFVTPYRARISIGKLFEPKKVKAHISLLAEEWVNKYPRLIDIVKEYKKTRKHD